MLLVNRFTLFSFIFGFVVWQAKFHKDRLLEVLETAQNWLEQPSVGQDGQIETDLYGKGLSYTLRGSSSPSSLIRITKLQVAQYPVAGKPFNVSIGFSTQQALGTGLRANATAKLRNVEVWSDECVVCDELLKHQEAISCPIPVGQHLLTVPILLPTNIPRARYAVTLRLWDAELEKSNELLLDANFLFHGTWLEVYENTMEYLKMYLGKLINLMSRGLVGRQPQRPRASGNARPRAPPERADL